MVNLDALITALRGGDSLAASDAIRALAEIDDDRARVALVEALAGVGPLTALAIQALARHGPKAQRFAAAATSDPQRKLGAVAVMGQLGDPSCCAQLRRLIDEPDPLVRMTVASSLYRCGERDSELWSSWICRENDLAVFAFLAAIAGCVNLPPATLDHLEAQAVNANTPAEVRAGAVWAIAQHDIDGGTALAKKLLVDPGVAFALSSVVRRRGGPLAWLIIAIRGDPATDQIADSIGLRHPGRG